MNYKNFAREMQLYNLYMPNKHNLLYILTFKVLHQIPCKIKRVLHFEWRGRVSTCFPRQTNTKVEILFLWETTTLSGTRPVLATVVRSYKPVRCHPGSAHIACSSRPQVAKPAKKSCKTQVYCVPKSCVPPRVGKRTPHIV
jgi:hypothetical protein